MVLVGVGREGNVKMETLGDYCTSLRDPVILIREIVLQMERRDTDL